MESLMHVPVYEVIIQYPAVGDLLSANGVDCKADTCLLKDVLTVHGFSLESAQPVMAEISNLIKTHDPLPFVPSASSFGEGFRLPEDRMLEVENEPGSLSDPLRELVEEHQLIARLLAFGTRLLMRGNWHAGDESIAKEFLHQLQTYVEQFHHAKEENLLFRETDGSQAIIKAMFSEHEAGRKLLDQAKEAFGRKEISMFETTLRQYGELQHGHMRREKDLLFPWMERVMTPERKAILTEAFDRLDTREGSDLQGTLEAFLESAEQRMMVVHPLSTPFFAGRETKSESLLNRPDLAIGHVILPPGAKLETFQTHTHIYLILLHGMLTIQFSETQQESFAQGNLIHLPPEVSIRYINEGPGTVEFFEITAPNPRDPFS